MKSGLQRKKDIKLPNLLKDSTIRIQEWFVQIQISKLPVCQGSREMLMVRVTNTITAIKWIMDFCCHTLGWARQQYKNKNNIYNKNTYLVRKAGSSNGVILLVQRLVKMKYVMINRQAYFYFSIFLPEENCSLKMQ